MNSVLDQLAENSVVCCWGHHLLVLCVMLMISFGSHFICYMENVEYYVTHMQPHMHGGTFNTKRNTVDLFSFTADRMPSSSYTFQGYCVTVSVSHLGHILKHNLDDKLDILRTIKNLHHKAITLFSTVHPFVKSTLLKILMSFLI